MVPLVLAAYLMTHVLVGGGCVMRGRIKVDVLMEDVLGEGVLLGHMYW